MDEIVMSIASQGFFQHEPLFAVRRASKYTVVEGNRRLAAVMLLRNRELCEEIGATDVPRISGSARAALEELPVIVCNDRREIWPFFGFRHVNGPKNWESFAKAVYIAQIHNEYRVSLNGIANSIGDKHETVKRLYRGLMVLEQAETEGVYSREDRWKGHFSFSHLYTGLDSPAFRSFLGLHDGHKVNPISKSKLPNLGELLVWLFGSESRNKPPVVRRQNPDLRILADILLERRAVDALRKGLPLDISHRYSFSDERVFREALVSAKRELELAKGAVIGGYKGEPYLLSDAGIIRDLAVSLYEDMEEKAEQRRARRKSSGRARQ